MRRHSAVDATAPYVLAALAAAVYAATLTAPVFGDDRVFVEGSAALGLPFGAFLRGLLSRDYLSFTGEGTYQPLVTLFHYATRGHPAVYRAAGVALHAVNACLLHRAARRLGVAPVGAFLSAALFALFPAHAETLIVSSFKGNLLALGFSLSALLCWIEAVESGSRRATAGAFAFFALALASKETGLLAAGLLASYSLLFARKTRVGLQRRAGLGLALMSACYLFWRFRGLETGWMPPSPHSPSLLFGWYVKMLVWPHPLCRVRTAPAGWEWHALTAFFFAALWKARRRPAVLFGLFATVLGLLPVLQRAQYYMDSPVADRFLYAAAAGFALALGAAASSPAATAALAAAGLAWGAIGLQRNLLYRDTRALYEQTVACAPGHFKAWGILSQSQLAAGEYEAARESARRAVILNPQYPGGLRVLAEASERLGDLEQARAARSLERALLEPEDGR